MKITARIKRLTTGAVLAVMVAVPAKADNLADALVGAYNTSGLLEQNRALLRAADEDVAIALSALRPIISWPASVMRNLNDTDTLDLFGQPTRRSSRTTDVTNSLRAQWLLWDNGATRLGLKAAKEGVLATRQGLVAVEQQILLRAVAAYMRVIGTNELVQLSRNNVRVLSEELRAAQDRFDVGEVTRTDVALSESRLAAARSNLASSIGDQRNAQEEYLNAVGRKPGTLAQPPALPKRPESIAAGKAIAVRSHPNILSAQHQVAAQDILVRQARAGMGARADVIGNLSISDQYNDPAGSNSAQVGVQLSQTLYGGGRLAAQVRKAMANRDAARAGLLETSEAVTQEVNAAYVGVKVAQANLRATGQRIEAAQIAFDGVREEAKLGARTTLDVLDSEQELLDARAAKISAQAQLHVAAYQLLAAQGLLTAEGLGLKVQIYDPSAYYNSVRGAPAALSKQGRDLDRVLRALGKQ